MNQKNQKYRVFVEARAARLYLVCEFGRCSGLKKYKEAVRYRHGLIDMAEVLPAFLFPANTKAQCQSIVQRVTTIAAWQVGRLRKACPGFVTIIEAR